MRLQRIFAHVKRLLPNWLSAIIRRWATAILTPIRFSVVTGHWKSSLRAAAVAADGNPLPWFTYPAIDFLAGRNFKDRNILEFGGGQSTLWWARRSKQVWTIEEDLAWYNKISSGAPSNVKVFHSPADRRSRNVSEIERLLQHHAIPTFDVIVIDGHLRKELLRVAFQLLAPGGFILFDNAEGYGFYGELQKFVCNRVDFYGFAPGVSLRHCTSVVFIERCFLFEREIPIVDIDNRLSRLARRGSNHTTNPHRLGALGPVEEC